MSNHNESSDVATLAQQLHELQEEVTGLRNDVRDLVDAWNTARGLVKFVKLIGAVSIALAGIMAAIKIGFTGKP